MIVLVEFDNQTLLVGVTGNSMTLLTPSARERTALEESPELRGAHRIACGEEQ
jgi:flagellar biogenesis protein FliO